MQIGKRHVDLEDIVMGALVVSFILVVLVLAFGLAGMFVYCAFGDVDAPRYQYICGHSVDIK